MPSGSGLTSPNIGAPTVLTGDAPDGPTQMNDITRFADMLAAFDALQNGVVAAADGVFSPNSVSTSTGGMSAPTTSGGTAWIKLASGLLVRCAIPTTSAALTPASLPASGQTAAYGIDLVPPATPGVNGAVCTLAITAKGADSAGAVAALAAAPAVAAGHLRIADLAINNASGTITLTLQRDRRPNARGALADSTATTIAGAGIGTGGSTPTAGIRAELTGAPCLIVWSGRITVASGAPTACLLQPIMDGSAANLTLTSAGSASFAIQSAGSTGVAASGILSPSPAAGSHFFQLQAAPSAGTVNLTLGSITVIEFVRAPFGNGTS